VLAETVGHAFLVTASADGVPHPAAAGELRSGSEGEVLVAEWFCPGTMESLEQNEAVAVAWDAEADRRYQLMGRNGGDPRPLQSGSAHRRAGVRGWMERAMFSPRGDCW